MQTIDRLKKIATNTGTGARKGSIKKRTQIYNAATGHYILRDKDTGKFVGIKRDGKPYKGVRKEKTKILVNPIIDKVTADTIERDVIKIRNKRRITA